jgi:aminoglycoside/choline kinase family phosphotransferase
VSNVVPFRDAAATLEGAARKAAIKAYWKAAEAVAADAIAKDLQRGAAAVTLREAKHRGRFVVLPTPTMRAA